MAEPKSSYDKFAGVTINSTSGNDLPVGFLENFTITLDMRQEISQSGVTNYFMVVGSVAVNGYILPSSGQSLLLLIDDTNRIAFSTALNSQTRPFGRIVFYPATEDQLRSVAAAVRCDVRVVQAFGPPIDKKLAKKNLQNFRDFAIKYLPPAPHLAQKFNPHLVIHS